MRLFVNLRKSLFLKFTFANLGLRLLILTTFSCANLHLRVRSLNKVYFTLHCLCSGLSLLIYVNNYCH